MSEQEFYLVVITATKGIDKSLILKWEKNFEKYGATHQLLDDKRPVFAVLVQSENEQTAEILGKAIIDRVLHFLDVESVKVFKKSDVQNA